jgi:hypothetical protein
MWTFLTIGGVVAAGVIGVTRLLQRPSRQPKRLRQETVVDPTSDQFPEPGSDEVPRRPDGSVVPGSEPHRHRHGRA